MTTVGFFNNKGGVGKTSIVYHLAWVFADLGVNVVAADFDPQANLTSMFLEEERLEKLWPESEHHKSIMEARKPIFIFFLKPADGAIGSHARAVQDCYKDYKALAMQIAKRCGISSIWFCRPKKLFSLAK